MKKTESNRYILFHHEKLMTSMAEFSKEISHFFNHIVYVTSLKLIYNTKRYDSVYGYQKEFEQITIF